MKKFLQMIGILTVVFIVAVGVFIFYCSNVGSKFDKESKSFVDGNFKSIFSTWDPGQLHRLSSSELLSGVSQDKIERMFKFFSEKLGPLQEYQGCAGDSNVNMSPGGKVTSARYLAKARFTKGEASITLILVLKGNKWWIAGLHVGSPLLVP